MFGPESGYLWILPDAISGSMTSVKAQTDSVGTLTGEKEEEEMEEERRGLLWVFDYTYN
jgi:hypothetical protein